MGSGVISETEMTPDPIFPARTDFKLISYRHHRKRGDPAPSLLEVVDGARTSSSRDPGTSDASADLVAAGQHPHVHFGSRVRRDRPLRRAHCHGAPPVSAVGVRAQGIL